MVAPSRVLASLEHPRDHPANGASLMTDPAKSSLHGPVLTPSPGHCFGCGPPNPHGLHLQFTFDAAAPPLTAPVHLTRMLEVPPARIHGGIIATLTDEAMSKLNRLFVVLAMARHM